MTREGALLVIIAVTAVLIGLGVWAWVRRSRRDAGYPAPIGDVPPGAQVFGRYPGLYVATTRHDEPLERLAIRGLGFRSTADIAVTDAGVVLDIPGQPRMLIGAARIVDAGQATVAIDRVVERDGLTRLSWRIDRDTVVDTYLRPQETSAKALADDIRAHSQTGTSP